MHTYEEIIKNLYDDFSEEISSGTKYLEMAESADMLGNTELAGGLATMAHEEYTHGKYILMNLKRAGSQLSDDCWHKWHEFEAKIHQVFHRK